MPVVAEISLDPWLKFRRHKGLVLEIGVVRIICVPGIKGERGLDDRQVVLILKVGRLNRRKAVPVGGSQARLQQEAQKEIMRDPGCRIRGTKNSQDLRSVAVVAEIMS